MIKLAFLFVAIWFTLINTMKLMHKHKECIPSINIVIQAIGITGFVWLQFFK